MIGTIKHTNPSGYGFIEVDGVGYFFLSTDVFGEIHFAEARKHNCAEFDPADGDRGKIAKNVHITRPDLLRFTGRVRTIHAGYAFLQADNTRKTVFAHRSEFPGGRIEESDLDRPCSYAIVECAKGIQALQVEFI